MKIIFKNRLEAIDWIAEKAEDEGQFEVMREKLNFNFIYTGQLFLDSSINVDEVVFLDDENQD